MYCSELPDLVNQPLPLPSHDTAQLKEWKREWKPYERGWMKGRKDGSIGPESATYSKPTCDGRETITFTMKWTNVNLHQSPIKMSGCSRSDFLLWILNTSESIVGLRQALIVDWPNDWSLGFLVNSMRLVIHSAWGSSGKPIFTYSVHICLYLQISKIAYLPTVY